jgi:hypothetical protein
VIGVLVLLSNLRIGADWLDMDHLWPAVLMLLGVLGLASTFTGQSKDKSGIWFGIVGLLVGGVFLWITLGAGEWEDMAEWWPLFPAIAGLGWVVQWLFERQAVADLALGIGAWAVAVVGYLVVRGTIAKEQALRIADLWPLILVLVGVGLITQFLVQRKKS